MFVFVSAVALYALFVIYCWLKFVTESGSVVFAEKSKLMLRSLQNPRERKMADPNATKALHSYLLPPR